MFSYMRWDDIDAVSVCLSAGKLEEEEKVACGRGDAESSSAICVPRWKRKAWRHARMLPKWQVRSRPVWRDGHHDQKELHLLFCVSLLQDDLIVSDGNGL